MDNKITIVEGPTPTFEPVNSDWVDSICESSEQSDIFMTNLRTMNGNGLMERCRSTWDEDDIMYLHFRNTIGLEQRVPIVAAQMIDTEDGEKLVLWVRMEADQLNHTYVAGEDDEEE